MMRKIIATKAQTAIQMWVIAKSQAIDEICCVGKHAPTTGFLDTLKRHSTTRAVTSRRHSLQWCDRQPTTLLRGQPLTGQHHLSLGRRLVAFLF